MITPSPTSPIAPGLARGVYAGPVATPPGRPARIKFGVPDTSYELYLVAHRPEAEIGKRLVGVIRAQARRIDVVTTGGEYIEPVVGRPRRVQGRVLRTEGGAVVVDAGVPIHCTPTDPSQSAAQFKPGDLVSFDVLEGASFEPGPTR